MSQLEELIAVQPIFRQLDPSKRTKIARSAVRKDYKKGELIALRGHHWYGVMLLESGLVGCVKDNSDNRTLCCRVLHRHDMYWGHSIFDDNPLLFHLEVIKSTRAYLWDANDILPILKENPAALWDLCQHVISLTRMACVKLELLALKTVPCRVAELLVQRFAFSCRGSFERDLTLEEIAAMVGSKPPVVSRILHELADQGLIEVTRTRVTVLDLDRLIDVSNEFDR